MIQKVEVELPEWLDSFIVANIGVPMLTNIQYNGEPQEGSSVLMEVVVKTYNGTIRPLFSRGTMTKLGIENMDGLVDALSQYLYIEALMPEASKEEMV